MTHLENKTTKSAQLYWGGLATLLFGILIAAVFLIVQMVMIGILTGIEAASHQGADIDLIMEELTGSGVVLSVVTFTTSLICLPIIFLIIRVKQGLTIRQYLGIKFTSVKKILPWFAAITTFLICYDVTTHIIGRPIVPEFMTTAYKTAKFKPLLWMALVVAAPLSEEFFFRGFLFKGFQSTFLRPVGTVVLTAFLWAIIHMQYDYYDISFVFIIGILLGAARIKSESVLTAIYLHSFMNLVATIETAIVVS